jgi:hypothetical protein
MCSHHITFFNTQDIRLYLLLHSHRRITYQLFLLYVLQHHSYAAVDCCRTLNGLASLAK